MVWNGCDLQRTQTNPFTHHLNYSTLPSTSLLAPRPLRACPERSEGVTQNGDCREFGNTVAKYYVRRLVAPLINSRRRARLHVG